MKAINFIFRKGFIILAVLLITQSNAIFSQKPYYQRPDYNYGVQINEVLNGSGHGLLTELDFIIGNKKNEFALGGFSQDQFKNIAGISLQYKYFVTSYEDVNLFVHYSFLYHYQNRLSKDLNEVFHPQTSSLEFEKFNTISNSVGIGVEALLKKNFYLNAKIAAGGYISNVVGLDNRNMNVICREDKGFSVMAGIGLSYKINTKDKRRRR